MVKGKHRYCPNVLLTCIDPRLHQRADGRNFVADFIKEFIRGDCILITRGGGVQDLFHTSRGFRMALKRDVEIATILHNTENFYMANHEDCGGYAEHNFRSRTDEVNKHIQDLHLAAELIKSDYALKRIRLFFAYLTDRKNDKFTFKRAG